MLNWMIKQIWLWHHHRRYKRKKFTVVSCHYGRNQVGPTFFLSRWLLVTKPARQRTASLKLIIQRTSFPLLSSQTRGQVKFLTSCIIFISRTGDSNCCSCIHCNTSVLQVFYCFCCYYYGFYHGYYVYAY